MAVEARGKRCHNFNTCPCWIHKIITHTCHLFVMILSQLTYLHIKALIKISKERNAYFKINSEGDPCTASKVVLFLFAVVFLFVCLLFTRLSLIFMKCLLWLKSNGEMCQFAGKRLLRTMTFCECVSLKQRLLPHFAHAPKPPYWWLCFHAPLSH